MKLNTNKLSRIALHIFFWVTVFLVFIIFYGQKKATYFTVFYQLIITMPVYISTTYFTIYFIIPRYLSRRQYLKSIIYFIYTSLAAIFLELIIIIYGMIIVVWNKGAFWERIRPSYVDAYSLIAGIHFVIILASAIKVLKLWYESQNRYKELERKKIEAELQFLKAQMHPHFLFNTLNNLYALTLKKSDQAPDVVLKISSILDYILYQCNGERVDLEKEIKLVKDYIELEKLRCGDRCDVNFSINGSVDSMQIMPLIFLPFVENAFKHGVAKNSEKSWIKIELNIAHRNIEFQISNSYKSEPDTTGSGIGLNNVKARLNAVYGNNYVLKIDNSDNIYSVDLTIKFEDKNGI